MNRSRKMRWVGRRSALLTPFSFPIKRQKRGWVGLLYVLPAALILGIFQLFPVIYAGWLSLTDANFLRQTVNFVGLAQYQKMLADPAFHMAVKNTLVYTAGVVVISGILGLLLAVALNRRFPGIGVYRTLLFLPVVTATSTAAVVWRWMYAPNASGLLNQIIGLFGMSPERWLLNPQLALPAVMAMSIWQSTGYSMIIFLAGLQGISRHVVEASKVDGAGWWQRFVHITLPLLSPTIFFVIVISVIHSFQAVSQVMVLTEGGPLRRTLVVVYYLYQQAFGSFNMAYGAAIAMTLFVILAVFTLIQWKVSEKRVHYGE